MKVGIPTEVHPGERRVAATPQTVKRLRSHGLEVVVQAGAGIRADISDTEYESAGATISSDPRVVWSCDAVLKVRSPEVHPSLGVHEADLLREGAILISFIWPATSRDLVERLARRGVSALAMDAVPRITRAQKCDALSAMAGIAGYRAIIEAAAHFPRFFTGQVTAAGRVEPAKVLVIGAGVAGLAAIATARGLGAIVRAFDTRPATKDQVRSLGAEFLEIGINESGEGAGGYAKEVSKAFIEAEMALFARQAREVDVIITTALIPGKPAPRLITREMVESMKRGSVIVDLAAEQGGNCELTRADQIVNHNGVTIIGHTDLPSRMAPQSSQLYASTVTALLEEVLKDGRIVVDEGDEVVRGALVTHAGRVTWPPPALPPAPATAQAPRSEAPSTKPVAKPARSSPARTITFFLIAALLLAIGLFAPESFVQHLTVFVLSCFVGWQVIWNVTPALHTPLMSVTNAISGIIIIGGMLNLASDGSRTVQILGALAVLVAAINIAGGFLVTQRMLTMFRR
jgi:NAD(P) transhydrogenase subunit alpha